MPFFFFLPCCSALSVGPVCASPWPFPSAYLCIIIVSVQLVLQPLYPFIHSHPSFPPFLEGFSVSVCQPDSLVRQSIRQQGTAHSRIAAGGNLADSRRCPQQRSLVSPFKHWINCHSGPSRCTSTGGCYQYCLFRFPFHRLEFEQKRGTVLSSFYLYHLSFVSRLPPHANASASEAPPTISFEAGPGPWTSSSVVTHYHLPRASSPPSPPRFWGRPITPWSQHRPSEKPLSSSSSASSSCQ